MTPPSLVLVPTQGDAPPERADVSALTGWAACVRPMVQHMAPDQAAAILRMVAARCLVASEANGRR